MADTENLTSGWVDDGLSTSLSTLATQGEGQALEFMRGFPENTRELAKEIAAFASSNDGTILLGIDDDGGFFGLSEAATAAGRDSLISRLQGICSKTVEPAITPTVRFGHRDGKIVMAIYVKRGTQPIYYASHTPYVRHLTEARPATPSEVIDAIKEWLDAGAEEADPIAERRRQIYTHVREILVTQRIFVEEQQYRKLNPWLEQWRYRCAAQAVHLRTYSVDALIIADNRADGLKDYAAVLDEFASFRMHMGMGPQLDAMIEEIGSSAEKLLTEIFGNSPLGEEDIVKVKEAISGYERKLGLLASRTQSMANSARVKEIQSEAAEIGWPLLLISQYDLSPLGEGIQERLHDAGFNLHVLETAQIYMDGGASVQKILDIVDDAHRELTEIVDLLD